MTRRALAMVLATVVCGTLACGPGHGPPLERFTIPRNAAFFIAVLEMAVIAGAIVLAVVMPLQGRGRNSTQTLSPGPEGENRPVR